LNLYIIVEFASLSRMVDTLSMAYTHGLDNDGYLHGILGGCKQVMKNDAYSV